MFIRDAFFSWGTHICVCTHGARPSSVHAWVEHAPRSFVFFCLSRVVLRIDAIHVVHCVVTGHKIKSIVEHPSGEYDRLVCVSHRVFGNHSVAESLSWAVDCKVERCPLPASRTKNNAVRLRPINFLGSFFCPKSRKVLEGSRFPKESESTHPATNPAGAPCPQRHLRLRLAPFPPAYGPFACGKMDQVRP